MNQENEMILTFSSQSQNEAFARVAITAFVSQLDPTLTEVTDIKTAVSEAVTNAIIHGYENQMGMVSMKCVLSGSIVTIEVWDEGKGITDIEQARQPLYTSKPELERSGMGFTVMEMFMDHVEIESNPGQGTKVIMVKELKKTQSEG